MKAALDTNAIIDLCNNDSWTDRVARHFETVQKDMLFLVAHAWDELDEHRLGEQASVNLRHLEAVFSHDNQRYFTIGQSVIGGPDVMRGDTAKHDGIQGVVRDMQPAYERYRMRQQMSGAPAKSIEKWISKNNNQADAVIYERAAELGCDYLVTRDGRIGRVVPAKNRCQPITLASFIAKLEL